MGRTASREVVEAFGAFLRRRTTLSDEDVRSRMDDLRGGRLHAATASTILSGDPASTVQRAVGAPEGALTAADVSTEEARRRLAGLAERVAAQLQAGEVPSFDLPDLHGSNAIHDSRGNVFLGPKVRRVALDRRGGEAFMRILLALEVASDNLRDASCTTKRGLYYHHQTVLPDDDRDQRNTDRAITSLASLLGVRRRALGFVEARRGSVFGRLVLRQGGAVVDVAQLGPAGHPVPRFTDEVEILGSDARFVLVIEKQSVAQRVAQTRWWEKVPCVLVCSEGFPSLSTRELLKSLVDTLRVRVLVCADADPSGIQLALTCAHGSIATALETRWLACDDVWWAGLRPSAIDRHTGVDGHIPLADTDYEAARRLREHPSYAHVRQEVRDEVAILVERRVKVEIDALMRDMPRLVDEHLPRMLLESEPLRL